jgi:hypothetical protein
VRPGASPLNSPAVRIVASRSGVARARGRIRRRERRRAFVGLGQGACELADLTAADWLPGDLQAHELVEPAVDCRA